MEAHALTLLELRQKIGAIDGRIPRETHGFRYLQQPIAKGSVVEFAGQGKTELCAHFLSEHPELSVAWVEDEFSLNPYALWQRHLNFENLVFVEAGRDMSWAIHQLLHSQAFDLIVSSGRQWEENELRRFQLLSEKAKSTFFLLSEKPQPAWVQSLQVQTRRDDGGLLQTRILRNRITG